MAQKIQLSVEGMTCGHCQAAVQQSIAAVPGVERVTVSLEAGTARAFVSDDTNIDDLISAVEAAGYYADSGILP